jgi:heterodisulfide reductase subunit A-like polyferredoxin
MNTRNGISTRPATLCMTVCVGIVLLACLTASRSHAGQFDYAVLAKGQSVKKTAELAGPVDAFIVPVLLLGSGVCKATVSLSEQTSTTVLGIAVAGVCRGPYSVVDYNGAPGSHSASAQVTIEEYGLIFLAGTAAGPAENFPLKLVLNVQF